MKHKHRDYASEIDAAILEYEDRKPYKRFKTAWIADRIAWCYKFRHITHEQMASFCDRMMYIYDHAEAYGLLEY